MILDEILANKRREVEERRAKRPLEHPAAPRSRPPGSAETTLKTATASTNFPGTADGATGAPGGSALEPATSGASVTAYAAGTADTAGTTLSEDTTPIAGTPLVAGGTRITDTAHSGGGSCVVASRSRFVDVLRQPGVSFIAEIKRRSPSGGLIRPDLAVAQIAQTYATAGAAALSVLTDQRYFGGADADLTSAQRASGLPCLRKDFVVDPYQILEAHELGASAVLLIVRALSDNELRSLLELTHTCGMEALVETHSAAEVERALCAGARVVGVNNRDLDTLITDVSLAPRLRPLVPADCVFVAESGISQPEHVARLRDAGVDAVLVGESLLRAADPGARLSALIAAGAPGDVPGGAQ
ncbi:MAG: indole-3-glycerol phosphate synthase TrpC [Chloroflexota bacterium]